MDAKHRESDIKSPSIISNSPKKSGKYLTKTAGLLLTVLPLLSMQTALADIIVWDGDTSVNWSDGGNWSGNSAAGAGDTAFFSDNAPTNQPEINVAAITIDGIEYDSSITGSTLGVNQNLTIATDGIVNRVATNTQTITVASTFTLNLQAGNIAAGVNLVNNGSFDVNSDSDITVNEPITGTGDLTKSGAGTLTLLGTSTFSGGTTVDEGNLQLGDGLAEGNIDTSGVAGIDVAAGAGLIFNSPDTLSFGDVISGDGTVTQSGADTLTLTNDNLYTGKTTVNSGGLRIGNGGAAGSLQSSEVELADSNVDLTFNSTTNSTFAGNITGLGSLVKSGNNTLTLTGTGNSYLGNTTVNAGILQIGDNATTDAGTLGSTVSLADGAELQFNRPDQYVYGGVISDADAETGVGIVRQAGDGTLVLTGNSTYTAPTIIDAGTLQIGNNSLAGSVASDITNNSALVFYRSDDLVTYAGAIDGAGSLSKMGSGILALNGDSSLFTGVTTVDQGTLLVGDANNTDVVLGDGSNSLTVADGATLGGFGTVAADVTVQYGATMSPGASIGTLTIDGDYVQEAGSTYLVELDGLGNSDSVTVTGSADIQGGDLVMNVDAGFIPGHTYTILTTTGGFVTDPQFDNVTAVTATTDLLTQNFLAAEVQQFASPTGDEEILLVPEYNATRFATAAQTPNQQAVADYIIATGGTTSVQNLIAGITTDEEFQVAMDQISGATYANQVLQVAQVGRWFDSQMMDRVDFYPQCEGVMDAKSTHSWPDNCPRTRSVWVTPYASSANIDADDVSGLDTSMGGVAVGADFPVADTAEVGVAFAGSYFSSDISGDNENGSDDGTLYQFGVYGSYHMNDWTLAASIAVGATDDISATRNIGTANGGTISVDGSYSTTIVSEQLRATYVKQVNQTRILPFIGLVGQQVSADSFTETGDVDFALNVSDSDYNSFKSQLGSSVQVPMAHMTFLATVAWQHEFSDTQGTFTAYIDQLGDAQTFDVVGTDIGSDSALIKVGVVLLEKGRVNLTASYEGVFASSYSENGGKLQLDFDLS